MTSMLDIIEDFLAGRAISFCRLDGDTPSADRQTSIDRFNANNGSVSCFLLSTRAGGLGINLASADTIIMYDTDWNPHVDMQAYARAHRFGQKRTVMVYKFVTLNTVEEAVVAKTKKKLLLDHAIVENMAESLNAEDWTELAKFGAMNIFADQDAPLTYTDEMITTLLDRLGCV
jgi:chromodomain-helicase-DNA-binding protein 4